jgi:hypothetical protein
MTDQEVICAWMEPKPDKGPFDFRPWSDGTPGGWWEAVPEARFCSPVNEWLPRTLTLDALWEVEERLVSEALEFESEKSSEQFCRMRLHDYQRQLIKTTNWQQWHATAEQKIKVLAQVLRPIVEASNA